MADLEQRVAILERQMSDLKARVATNEEDAKSVPDLIKIEFRLVNSQIARLSRDVAELQTGMARLSDLPEKVEALPRVLAEMLAERDRKR
jgi:cell division protein FtsB